MAKQLTVSNIVAMAKVEYEDKCPAELKLHLMGVKERRSKELESYREKHSLVVAARAREYTFGETLEDFKSGYRGEAILQHKASKKNLKYLDKVAENRFNFLKSKASKPLRVRIEQKMSTKILDRVVRGRDDLEEEFEDYINIIEFKNKYQPDVYDMIQVSLYRLIRGEKQKKDVRARIELLPSCEQIPVDMDMRKFKNNVIEWVRDIEKLEKKPLNNVLRNRDFCDKCSYGVWKRVLCPLLFN